MATKEQTPQNGNDVFIDVEGSSNQHHVIRVDIPDRIGCAYQCMDCNQVFNNYDSFRYVEC